MDLFFTCEGVSFWLSIFLISQEIIFIFSSQIDECIYHHHEYQYYYYITSYECIQIISHLVY